MIPIKIILPAITFFAVVGANLAFKAQKYSLAKIYTTTHIHEGALCPFTKDVIAYTIVDIGFLTFAATTPPDLSHPEGYPCELFSTTEE